MQTANEQSTPTMPIIPPLVIPAADPSAEQPAEKQKRRRNVKEKLGRPPSATALLKKEIQSNLRYLSEKQLNQVAKSVRKHVEKNNAENESQDQSSDDNAAAVQDLKETVEQLPAVADVVQSNSAELAAQKVAKAANVVIVPPTQVKVRGRKPAAKKADKPSA